MIQSTRTGAEYGILFKSNWNGKQFFKSLDTVNQNRFGYVDFEKVQEMNGTFISNQVLNIDTVSKLEPKKLITKISFDDGEKWNRIQSPDVDAQGTPYNCGSDCYLNLHAFTDRHDIEDKFSSKGVVGYLAGIGKWLIYSR
jgi:hypothetical protein